MNRHPLKRPTPPPRRPTGDRRHQLIHAVRLLSAAAIAAAVLVLGAAPEAAFAAAPADMVLAADSIATVLGNVRAWAMTFLAAWASLCLTIGFLRYTSGEPGEVERGKTAFRSAAIGYAGALLVPLLLTIIAAWTK
ncbi:pilin [Actinoplanes sp. NPDC020271]|uniref:pilin n=1 Tax=Actinoplanes sp. NPDC020271 TaxID=3363896 RepID=UPI0037A7F22A